MEGCFHMWQTVKLQGLKGQTDETNSHQAHFKEAVQKRTVNGILTYRCRGVLFSPKKQGLQDADFNRNLGLSLLWQGTPPPCSELQFPLPTPTISRGRDALELRFGAELRLTCHQGKIGSQVLKVQRRHLQERNCWTKLSRVEKTKRSWGPC